MSNMDDFFFRAFFKLKVHESHGTAFQQLINNLFSYGIEGFQSIAPWGKWGDGGNDGWIEATGTYYQVYGPAQTSNVSPDTAVQKAIGDFHKLPQKWKHVNSFFFVYNDHFGGAPAKLSSALQSLKEHQNLADCRALVGADLEQIFMSLDADQRQMIVGGIPSASPTYIDPSCVNVILSHLADIDTSPDFLMTLPPDLDEKITFNDLSEGVGNLLKMRWYQTSVIDQFLNARDPGFAQVIASDISRLYEKSKINVNFEDDRISDLRYVWMMDQLIPEVAHKHPHSLKAYRESAQVILSKYFETCDAYEHPEQSTSA